MNNSGSQESTVGLVSKAVLLLAERFFYIMHLHNRTEGMYSFAGKNRHIETENNGTPGVIVYQFIFCHQLYSGEATD